MTPQEQLSRDICDILDGSLGLNIWPRAWSVKWVKAQPHRFTENPYLKGLSVGGTYVLCFCGLPWLPYAFFHSYFNAPTAQLIFLQVYGGLWSGWATTTTSIASKSIFETIEKDIVPRLSDRVADAIILEIKSRFQRDKVLALSWIVAIVGAALAGYLVHHDLNSSIGETIWWSWGWTILFATAAKVVNTSRFYGVFSDHLGDDPEKLYCMAPAKSSLVIHVASVAQRMLLFWFGIAVSIGAAVPFGTKDIGVCLLYVGHTVLPSFFASTTSCSCKLDSNRNSFVLVDVLTSGFFSIGFGTIVFLRSESSICRAVKSVTQSTLRSIEAQVASLSGLAGSMDESDRNRLRELISQHQEVAAAGSYRSATISGISVLVPFVIPLIKYLLHMEGE